MSTIRFLILAKPITVELSRESLIEEFISSVGALVLTKKQMVCDSSRIARHYQQFASKPFFQGLVKYSTGKSIVYLLCEGTIEQLVAIREAMGSAKVSPDSFREKLVGDVWEERYQVSGVVDNGIHCSDSQEEGLREISIWFGVPPTSSRTYQAHKAVWKILSSISNVQSLQYAGGEHDGTGIPDGAIDLDYRLLTNNIASVVSSLEKRGLVIDKRGVDDETGAEYVKFEIRFSGGKCDIAVVPVQYYANQVSKSHLIYLVNYTLKGECRASKTIAKATGNKELYKDVKRQWRKRLLESINWEV